eukprot:5299202-Pyramimonas_sp.AAC.1
METDKPPTQGRRIFVVWGSSYDPLPLAPSLAFMAVSSPCPSPCPWQIPLLVHPLQGPPVLRRFLVQEPGH